MTSLGKLASGAGVIGTVVLGAFIHDNPLLVSAVGLAVAGSGILVWILSSDRRVERLNVLLRGAPLPRPTSSAGVPNRTLSPGCEGPDIQNSPMNWSTSWRSTRTKPASRPNAIVAGQHLDDIG